MTGTTLEKAAWFVSVVGTSMTLYSIIFGFFFGLALFIWIFRKELRLFLNIRRKVTIIKSAGNLMESESHLLRHVGFFNIDGPLSEFGINYLKKPTLVIIGWSEGMNNFAEVFNSAKAKNLPIIVYAPGDAKLVGEDCKLVSSYPFALMCQFQLRLINDVFGILSTFKHVS